MSYIIYKIKQKDNEQMFYIGSTVNFSRRKSHHKKNVTNKCGKLYWSRLYKHIRENGKWDNFEMTIIEYVDITTGIGLKQREQQIIDELKPPLNTGTAYKIKPI